MRLLALHGPCSIALLASVLAACSDALPHPHYVPQTTAFLVPVGFPPPPARVEFIPPRPRGDVVWLDGEWTWSGSKWAWLPGRWVRAPAGASFAPWTTVRDELGNVYFASGSWHDGAGRLVPSPPALAYGTSMAGDVTSPEGDSQATAVPPVGAPPSKTPP